MSIPGQYQGLQSAAGSWCREACSRSPVCNQMFTAFQAARRPQMPQWVHTGCGIHQLNAAMAASNSVKLLAFVGKHRLLVERITIPPGFSTRPTSFITCEVGIWNHHASWGHKNRRKLAIKEAKTTQLMGHPRSSKQISAALREAYFVHIPASKGLHK